MGEINSLIKKEKLMAWFYTVLLLPNSPLYALSEGEAQASLKEGKDPKGKTLWDWDRIHSDPEQGILAYQGISREESIGKAAEMIATWKGGKENLPKIILWGIQDPSDSVIEFKREILSRFETYFDQDTDNGGQIILYSGLMTNEEGEVVEYKE